MKKLNIVNNKILLNVLLIETNNVKNRYLIEYEHHITINDYINLDTAISILDKYKTPKSYEVRNYLMQHMQKTPRTSNLTSQSPIDIPLQSSSLQSLQKNDVVTTQTLKSEDKCLSFDEEKEIFLNKHSLIEKDVEKNILIEKDMNDCFYNYKNIKNSEKILYNKKIYMSNSHPYFKHYEYELYYQNMIEKEKNKNKLLEMKILELRKELEKEKHKYCIDYNKDGIIRIL